ncbi:MAG: ABC transporter permease [Pirellulaceae bacterium]
MSEATTELLSIVWRSVRVSGAAVIIAAAVGIPFGVWIGCRKFRGKSVVSAVVHTGMALPPVVIGLLLYILLSRSGPLAQLGWLFSEQAMILAQTLLALPFVVGITMNAVANVPRELIRQVRGLGATDLQCLEAILREARAGVILAVAAAFGRSISEVGAVLIVGGNIAGHTRLLTTAIVLETSKGRFEFALALGAVLLTLALLVNAAIVRFQVSRVLP